MTRMVLSPGPGTSAFGRPFPVTRPMPGRKYGIVPTGIADPRQADPGRAELVPFQLVRPNISWSTPRLRSLGATPSPGQRRTQPRGQRPKDEAVLESGFETDLMSLAEGG